MDPTKKTSSTNGGTHQNANLGDSEQKVMKQQEAGGGDVEYNNNYNGEKKIKRSQKKHRSLKRASKTAVTSNGQAALSSRRKNGTTSKSTQKNILINLGGQSSKRTSVENATNIGQESQANNNHEAPKNPKKRQKKQKQKSSKSQSPGEEEGHHEPAEKKRRSSISSDESEEEVQVADDKSYQPGNEGVDPTTVDDTIGEFSDGEEIGPEFSDGEEDDTMFHDNSSNQAVVVHAPTKREELKLRAMKILENLRSLGGGTAAATTAAAATTTGNSTGGDNNTGIISARPSQDESTTTTTQADKLVTELMDIFTEDSSLVIYFLQQTSSKPLYSTLYYVDGGYYYYSILEILVRAKTSLKNITKFYKMCPPEANDYEARGDDRLDVISALQAACEKTMTFKRDDVSLLLFLAKMQEKLQKERDKRPLKVPVDVDQPPSNCLRDNESSRTYSPRNCTTRAILFRILDNPKSSVDGIKILISRWPEALRCPHALGAALGRDDFLEYTDSLVACASSPQWQSFRNGWGELAVTNLSCCFGVARADVLIRMISSGKQTRARSRQNNINITPYVSWDIDGIVHFLNGLQRCGRQIRRITNLDFSSLGKLSLGKRHELLDTLFRTLSIQSNMSICRLHAKERDIAFASDLINGLEHCMTVNPEREFYVTYVIPASAGNCRFYYKRGAQALESQVTFCAFLSKNPGSADLLRALAAIPTIKNIYIALHYDSELDQYKYNKEELQVSVEEIAKMLRVSPTLQKISIHKTWECNLTPIYEALKENSNLVVLSWLFNYSSDFQHHSPTAEEIECCVDMLKNHNSILTECPTEGDPKIAYYLDLNRLGRRIARTAQSHQLVPLLLAAAQDTSPRISYSGRHHRNNRDRLVNHRQGMLYGLLRESPGLWSTALGTSPS